MGEVLVARVHRLEPAAIDGDDGPGEKIELTTQHEAPGSGLIAAACTALGLSRASLHRRQAFRRQPLAPVRRRPPPMRALVAQERQVVLHLLREPRFVDLAPAEVYACLLDQGLYLCSIRTMYRILAEHDEVRERRRQLRRPVYQKPELLAEGPNQVWSWDITKLMGPAKWSYFYLYVIIDIFSRRVVAWCIADAESACSNPCSTTPSSSTMSRPASSPCMPIAAAR